MSNQIYSYLNTFNSLDFDIIKDHPNILIAANFWEEDRYNAARICYKFMRMIDDLIDNYKTEHILIADREKKKFIDEVHRWIKAFKNKSNNNNQYDELTDTLTKYKIPFWIMEDFARSMIYDIHNDGFSTFNEFMDYTQGASVAPASIFVHLCGLQKFDGYYKAPLFDIRKASSPCAIFCYLVHIIRDFQKDQRNNLNYFADDLLKKNGLNRKDLKDISEGGMISQNFRSLVQEYYVMADMYRNKTFSIIREIEPYLESRYRLSLDIIFNLYLMVFERINVKEGLFTYEELNPTSREIKERVYRTINDFRMKTSG